MHRLALCLFLISSLGKVVVLDMFFYIWETKIVVAGRVRQVVILYSNDFIGICLGSFSIGHLRQVVVL